MKFKRKSTTAKSIVSQKAKIEINDRWVYGEGKLDESEYHSIDFLSAHKIKDLCNPNLSDYHIYRKHIARDLPEQSDSPALILGSLFHCMYLEPKELDNRYTVAPKVDKRTKQGKADWLEFVEQSADKTVVTNEQFMQCQQMVHTLNKNQYARRLRNHKNNHIEISGFWNTGKCIIKGRGDIVNFDLNLGVDAKTCEDVSPQGFATASAKYRYDIQAYTYMRLFNLHEFVFVCVSKKEPYEVGIYVLNDEFLCKAKEQFEGAIDRWISIHNQTEPQSFTTESEPMSVLAPPNWFNYL